MKTTTRFPLSGSAFALGTWGIIFLHTVLSGRVTNLLHPLFRPLVLGAGIILLILALIHLVALVPARESHVPGTGPFSRWLLLVLPVVVAALVCPKSYSSVAVRNRGSDNSNLAAQYSNLRSTEQSTAWQSADPSQPVPVEVMDLLLAPEDEAAMTSLEGRKIRISGQYVAVSASEFKITRMVMFCCAADAMPVAVPVEGAPGKIPDMQWVEATGTVRFISRLGKKQPHLKLDHVEKIPTPKESFSY